MEAAREESEKSNLKMPLLLGVTILTSLKDKDLNEIGFSSGSQAQVLRLAQLAWQAGLKAVVCSPQEIELLRTELGPELKIITPGIRPVWADAQDQKRIMTPAEAL
jgi:orotidine-5'-phosphate decarboxylase